MSIHINAKPGEIAPIVLMPGDPLRAKYMAEKFLQNVKLVSSTRNVYYFTGTYKDKPVTIGASGMGCPSIGIYSYELFNEYNVDCIIRIGTCGAYSTNLKLFDLVNVDRAFSESTYAKYAFGFSGDHLYHEGTAYAAINETAQELNMTVQKGAIHSSDIFYRSIKGIPAMAAENDCVAVEMEAFALFANAKQLKKSAATLLTVSDVIPTQEQISADQREKSLLPMMELALESVVNL
ncbi:MAG: purine-nucleoside phosphorylase [Chitinophagaceae bacterium]|jgi:purine-nucleoside phosphorylase|nr:purine-nucleoside phosphorylase [Chitinophagaceae bacterium]MBK9463215.1 purine-nucleoside phosphorylase [Chitinophagaceae bacterium]MBK9659655.1 purine-nucleoside phosphorylase [Chitinophagaceae bacterium]MBK9936807.1 purine-nucleoside phosphorylase [Chitinophagaceae bacterium]MBL0068630.1 purine-nucleoside phosphorylase [Chitinophagaceae bacterium]